MRASGGVLMDRGATTIPSSSGSAAMALKELDASAAEASRLRSVGSSSSLSSTVYEDDADTPVPSTATAAAPPVATTATPTLGFEPSNFFRFADFGTNAARGRDDFFAAQELLDNNEMLPPQTASPTNQATHEDADDAEAADIVAPTPTLPRSITHPRVSRRKNSIEMFLSQSPSQALGGGFLKMALDDDDHHAPNQPLPPPPDLDLRLDGSDAAVKAGAAAAGRPSHQVGAAPYGYLLSHSPPAVDTDDEWSSTSSQEMLSSSSASASAYYYTASQAALHQQSYAGYSGGAAEPFAAYGGSEAYSAREPHHHSQSWNATAGYGSLAPPYQHASTGPSLARYAPMHPPYHPQQQQQQGYQQGHRGHRGHGYARSQSMYATPSSRGMMDVPAYGAKQCKFFLQGHCRMGNKCKFAHHTPGHPVSAPLHHAQSFRLAQPSPASSPHHHHQQGDYDAAPPPAFLAPRGGATRASYRSDHHHQSHHSQAPPPPTAAAAGSSPAAMLDETLTVDDVHGRVFAMSKDQNGCRLLQEQLEFYDERKPLCDLIYAEAMDHLAEMMVDPFGNYLFQKLLERARPLQRLEMVRRVGSHLVAAALNLHGTRSVQKVVEVCATSAQVVELDSDGRESRRVHLPDLLVAALQDDAVRLCIDSNGNHVIQRALQFMKPEYNQFVFDAVAKECTTVGTHRHGCCVLQRCLDAANGQQKREVITQVEKQAMKLMQDPYGNYVVQYVLDSCTAEEAYGVMSKPLGSVFELSIQKFSSNVIEKCLEKAPPALLQQYVEEITLCAKMQKMLQDQFANYVVQRALSVAAEDQCLLLVKAIRPHLPAMKNTSGGRRITARILKRFPLMDLSLDLGFDAYSMSSYGQELHHPQHHQPPHHHQQPQYQSYQAAQQHFQYGAAPYGMMRSDRSDDGMPRM